MIEFDKWVYYMVKDSLINKKWAYDKFAYRRIQGERRWKNHAQQNRSWLFISLSVLSGRVCVSGYTFQPGTWFQVSDFYSKSW